MRNTIFSIFCFFFSLALSAQSLPYLHWQHLSTSDQLRNPSNNFLFKDSKGFLWIGSTSGLQRYDGFQVKDYGALPVDTFGILGKNIQGQIVEDGKNDLWITTYQALNHYDIKSEKFTPYPIKDGSNVISGFHSCGKTGDILWLLHKDSLRQFDLSKRKFIACTSTYPQRNFNRGMVKQFDNVTLVYTYNLGGNLLKIFEFRNQALIDFRETPLKDLGVYSIHPLNNETLLIGGKGGLKEVVIGAPQKDKTILWERKPLPSVQKISVFNEEELLITTVFGDLFRYDLKLKKIIGKLNFDVLKESDSDNSIITALVDKEQNIWISTKNDGIYFSFPDKTKFINHTVGSVVTGLVQRENDEIWAFTNKKIIVLDKEGRVVREIISDQPNKDNTEIYFAFEDSEKRLWTDYYISKQFHFFNPNAYESIKTNLSKHFTDGLLLRNGQTIFAHGVTKGLFSLQKQNDKFEIVQIPGTDTIVGPMNLYEDYKDNLVVVEKNNTKIVFYDMSDFTRKDSIPYIGQIYSMFMHPNDSVLWIGSVDGLVSFNYNTRSFTYHSKKNKLPNEVFGILPDETGNLWMSTNDGIYRFTPEDEKVIAYDQADGLGSERFSMNAHLKLKDGRLAFGGDNGLVIFDPKDITSEVPLAIPQITDILIAGKKRPDLKCENTGATNIEEIEKLHLNPKDNKLEFHFVAIEYSSSKENLIKYRLSPEEEEWKIVESGGKCQYTNIESGDYIFEIRAANSDGIWNKELTDTVVIHIPTPFRKTKAFIFLIVFIVSIIASMIVAVVVTFFQKQKRREEQIQFDKNIALEKQRLRIARDMHDDLGSRLSAISLKTAMLETKFEHPRWKKEMEKLTQDAQEISITIRETIWAVDARNDSLGKLIHYLINYTEELFDSLDTDYSFNISENQPDEQMVAGKIRRMVFLAYKEILNNIVKHAKASKVLIEMKMEKDHFILTITDNGVGFNLAEKEQGRGNGLDNMRYRMEKIGGTCRFLPTKKGTVVQLNFNFLDE